MFGSALADKRVLIIGYGRIGEAIERRLAGFEVASITRVARRARDGEPRVHATGELPDLVRDADVAIVIAPLTPETEGLVDAELLGLLPDDALLVNVARGKLVDTDALVAETATGRIRAALDVTDPEPLPPDHPLWQVPDVLIAPHVGGAELRVLAARRPTGGRAAAVASSPASRWTTRSVERRDGSCDHRPGLPVLQDRRRRDPVAADLRRRHGDRVPRHRLPGSGGTPWWYRASTSPTC